MLRIRDVYPGSDFFPSRIRIFSFPDPHIFLPGSASKNLSILTLKSISKLLEIWSGLFFLFFYPSRILDPGVKKAPYPGSGSATLFFYFFNDNFSSTSFAENGTVHRMAASSSHFISYIFVNLICCRMTCFDWRRTRLTCPTWTCPSPTSLPSWSAPTPPPRCSLHLRITLPVKWKSLAEYRIVYRSDSTRSVYLRWKPNVF